MSDNIQKYRWLSSILPRSDARKLILLTGARQTGKTTLARLTYPHLRYVNLDAPENRDLLREMPSPSWGRDIGKAIIDEAQKEPLVFDKVKYAFDGGDISFQVLLGSSQILLLRKIRETLAGRVSIFELWPLLMSELVTRGRGKKPKPPLAAALFTGAPIGGLLKGVPGSLPVEEAAPAREAEEHLLRWGGMPALLRLPAEDRAAWLRDYEYTYLERDLGDLARLDDLTPFRRFQKLSALHSGKLLNYSELARDAGISVDTARRYLEYLRLSYQTILLQPYHRNLTSSIIKTPKIYWLDIGLLRNLCGFSGDPTGELYETMVVGELFKWMQTLRLEGELFFYRTRSGLEVDLLLRTPGGIYGMEIKSRAAVSPLDTRALRDVARALGTEWSGGMVIYRGDVIRKVSEPDIWAIPSWRLFTGA